MLYVYDFDNLYKNSIIKHKIYLIEIETQKIKILKCKEE